MIFYRIIFFLLSFLVASCGEFEDGELLPGSILIRKGQDKRYCVYKNSDKHVIFLYENVADSVDYNALVWMNSKNMILGNALYYPWTSRSDCRSDIMEFDSTGKPTRTVYKSQNGEMAWMEFTSWDDEFLLFTTHQIYDRSGRRLNTLMPMLSLKVLSMRSGEIVHTIDNIGRAPSYAMLESPWLHDGHRFVWSIAQGPRLVGVGRDEIPHDALDDGVYVFDMRTGSSSLLLPNGEMAVVSPIQNSVAYILGQEVRILDMDHGADRFLAMLEPQEEVKAIHWTPSGDALFIGSTYDGRTFNEVLIDVHTGEESSVRRIGMTGSHFSWK